jgi:oxalate---CoA ligase
MSERDGQILGALVDARENAAAALISAETAESISFADLGSAVGRTAGQLAAAGVRRGDRVAIVLPNGPALVELVFALAALGAAVAPLNPAYTRDEFAFYLGDLAPRLLLVPPGYAGAARAAAPVETVDLDALAERPETPFEPGGPDDAALLLHTSGTTGQPKQVPLLQRNLVSSARTIAAFYRLGPDDVSFCAMPLFHVHGLVASVLAALASGGSVVIPRRLSARRFWPQARASGVTWVSAAPTLPQMLLDQRDAEGAPATLRFVRSCSSALSPSLMARAEGEYGVPMLEAYGMTEASHQMASNPLPPAPRITGSVGVPSGTEIEVVDRERRFLADGVAGEVVIRGPGVTAGYLANPEANAEAFFDGWFQTGDRGVLRDGYLYLEGRLKELIIRGGENVSPAEIEEVLRSHPAVTDAACFGVPDEKYGEQVACAVALAGEADERALLEHCRQRLTPVKVPKRLYVLSEIPRTPTGKLQRRRIAESLLR